VALAAVSRAPTEGPLQGARLADLGAGGGARQALRVVPARSLGAGDRGQLFQHLPPLLGGELGERLGVGGLDLVRRGGAQQVPVALDGLLVRRAR
jgi:hypothetical protein